MEDGQKSYLVLCLQMFLKDDVIFYIKIVNECAIHIRESSGQRNFWEKTVACDCIETVTENRFYLMSNVNCVRSGLRFAQFIK